jgi:hypothetical protein
MYSITYRSVCEPSFDEKSILKMLVKAQKKNKNLGITGCLLYHEKKFVQLLEGKEIAVKTVFAAIQEDNRHKEINILHGGAITYRLFNDWSMIFNNLNSKSDQVMHKRSLFDAIFHESSAVSNPSRSKIALWTNVYDVLYAEGTLAQ